MNGKRPQKGLLMLLALLVGLSVAFAGCAGGDDSGGEEDTGGEEQDGDGGVYARHPDAARTDPDPFPPQFGV